MIQNQDQDSCTCYKILMIIFSIAFITDALISGSKITEVIQMPTDYFLYSTNATGYQSQYMVSYGQLLSGNLHLQNCQRISIFSEFTKSSEVYINSRQLRVFMGIMTMFSIIIQLLICIDALASKQNNLCCPWLEQTKHKIYLMFSLSFIFLPFKTFFYGYRFQPNCIGQCFYNGISMFNYLILSLLPFIVFGFISMIHIFSTISFSEHWQNNFKCVYCYILGALISETGVIGTLSFYHDCPLQEIVVTMVPIFIEAVIMFVYSMQNTNVDVGERNDISLAGIFNRNDIQ